MYLALKKDPAIKAFLPDYPKGQYKDQEFFHKLVWSLYPVQIFNIISNAMKSRSVNAKQKDDYKIEMTNEMEKEIIEYVTLPSKHPVFLSISIGKPEKTIHLLKKKARNAKEWKALKKYEINYQLILNSIPNPRNDMNSSNNKPSMEATGQNYRDNEEIEYSFGDEETKDEMN